MKIDSVKIGFFYLISITKKNILPTISSGDKPEAVKALWKRTACAKTAGVTPEAESVFCTIAALRNKKYIYRIVGL